MNSDNGACGIDHGVVKGLMNMFDQENEIARTFKMVRNHFKESNFSPIQLRLIKKYRRDTTQCCSPAYFEIAGLIIRDLR